MANESLLIFGHLTGLQKVGAVSCSVVREHQGEVSAFTPGIAGMQADGTALASKAGHAEKKPIGQTKAIIDPQINDRIHGTNGRAVLVQSFNKPELASRVSDMARADSKTREQAWVDQLNSAFETTFRAGTQEVLLNQEKKGFFDILGTTYMPL